MIIIISLSLIVIGWLMIKVAERMPITKPEAIELDHKSTKEPTQRLKKEPKEPFVALGPGVSEDDRKALMAAIARAEANSSVLK